MFNALTRTLAGGAAAAGLLAAGLIVPSSALAAGTLSLTPSSGAGDTSTISAETSAGCSNAQATHYVVTLSGSGLKGDINMVGVTPLSAAGTDGSSTSSFIVKMSKTFDQVKLENGGLPTGGYTLTLACRARLNPAPLATFSTMLTITTNGSGTTWSEGYTPVMEPLVNVTKPKVSGVEKVKKTLKATAGTWEETPDKVTYQWKLGKKVIGKKSTLKVPTSAKGKTITLTVTATKAGYNPGKAVVKVKIKK